MPIKCKAVLSNLTVGERQVFRLVPKDTKKIDETEFLKRLADKTGQDVVQTRYWLDSFRDVYFRYLADNCAIDLNFLYGKLFVSGSIDSVTAQPTKDANPVKPRIYTKGELASALAALDIVNDTKTVGAVLDEVMQDGASDRNRIEATDVRVVANGSWLAIDPEQGDTGVCLANVNTGIVVATATVSYSDHSTVHFSFDTLPQTGQYRLVIATRDARDPEEFAVENLKRLVYVVND